MLVYKDKTLDELTNQELNDYHNLVSNTIEQLTREATASSPTRANDAQIRLGHWEERLSQIESFLNKQKEGK